jgi:hypothetical protein
MQVESKAAATDKGMGMTGLHWNPDIFDAMYGQDVSVGREFVPDERSVPGCEMV